MGRHCGLHRAFGVHPCGFVSCMSVCHPTSVQKAPKHIVVGARKRQFPIGVGPQRHRCPSTRGRRGLPGPQPRTPSGPTLTKRHPGPRPAPRWGKTVKRKSHTPRRVGRWWPHCSHWSHRASLPVLLCSSSPLYSPRFPAPLPAVPCISFVLQ